MRGSRLGIVGLSLGLMLGCKASQLEAPQDPTPDATSAVVVDPPESLVDRARQLLNDDSVEVLGERSLGIVHRLDDSYRGKSASAISDGMMDTVFYTAGTLYEHLGDDLDGLAQSFAYAGNVVATIKLTRASFERLNYDTKMVDVGEVESAAWQAVAERRITEDEAKAQADDAERAAYAEMLSVLPRDAVRIDRRYRP